MNHDAAIVIVSKDILELLKFVKEYSFRYPIELLHIVVHKDILTQERLFVNHYFL